MKGACFVFLSQSLALLCMSRDVLWPAALESYNEHQQPVKSKAVLGSCSAKLSSAQLSSAQPSLAERGPTWLMALCKAALTAHLADAESASLCCREAESAALARSLMKAGMKKMSAIQFKQALCLELLRCEAVMKEALPSIIKVGVRADPLRVVPAEFMTARLQFYAAFGFLRLPS